MTGLFYAARARVGRPQTSSCHQAAAAAEEIDQIGRLCFVRLTGETGLGPGDTSWAELGLGDSTNWDYETLLTGTRRLY